MNDNSLQILKPQQLGINANEQKAIDRVFTKKRSRENYCKLSEDKNQTLENWFQKTRYPKKEEYEAISEQVNEIIPKIENWFKHKRRKAMFEGSFQLYKRRRLLNEQEKLFLEEAFRVTMHPNKEKLHELAKTLKFSNKVISNWFSYRRKKFLRVNCCQQNTSKEGRKSYKQKKKFTNDVSSPESINLNGSGTGSSSDFSLPLNLNNNRQQTTNCTGPSESTGGQNSSNNNKSENNNENDNDSPKKNKKLHCEEANRFNTEDFQNQKKNEFNSNCQNLNFLMKNNGIMPNMYQQRPNINASFGYNGMNSMPTNQLQNFYPVNTNPINIQNFGNNMNRNMPTMYAPIILGQDCMLVPVMQQPLVMGYPQIPYYQNPILPNGPINYLQPMRNFNGFFPNNSNPMSMNLNMNHNHEGPRLETKGEQNSS